MTCCLAQAIVMIPTKEWLLQGRQVATSEAHNLPDPL